MRKLLIVPFVALLLAGCVNPRAVLVNPEGQRVLCQSAGFGILSGTLALNQFNKCVSEAQMRGFDPVSVK